MLWCRTTTSPLANFCNFYYKVRLLQLLSANAPGCVAYQRNTCSYHFRINRSTGRKQFMMRFPGKSKTNILPKAPRVMSSLWAILPGQAKGDPGYDHAFRWPHSIITCSCMTRGFARWPPRKDVPWGQPSSLLGTGLSLPSASPSLGSARCRAIAGETPEMLQMIQQDAFISIIPYDLTEQAETCTEQWKDLAGF